MTKPEALHIAMTAIMREFLREDGPLLPDFAAGPPPPIEPTGPQPRFDFVDDDFCEHNGHLVPRATCPVHGPDGEVVPTAEELDDLTTETFEEENPMIARARRLAERQMRQQSERLFPEDLPMAGAGPPPEIPPNLVV